MDEMMETESKAFIQARRKENWKQILSQFFFAGLFAASILLPPKGLGSDPSSLSFIAKVFMAFLPILVITVWTWSMTKDIRKLEDFDKSVAVNAFAIAFGAMLWVVTCYALLSVVFGFPDFPVILLAPMGVMMWHIIWIILRSSYL